MSARLVLVLLATGAVWFVSCSKGIGNNRRGRGPTGPVVAASSNLPTGFDPGVQLNQPAGEPAVAAVVVPAIGAGGTAREVALLAFTTTAVSNDANGAGTPLSRDATTDVNGASDVFVAAISAQAIETRAFSQSLAGKFRHPRCVTCHSMQAATTTAFVSAASIGYPHQGPLPGPTFPNNDPGVCAPCHVTSTSFPVPTWQAPAASFDMRTDTVAQLVTRANNVPAGDLVHFTSDARVLWALDTGILPQVGGNNGVADDDQDGIDEPEDRDGTPRPVPGGSTQFLQEISDWIASGRVATTTAAVKDVTLVSRAFGTTAAGNAASSRPRVRWVPNPAFNPTSAATASLSNPVGTLYVAYQSDASDLVAGDANAASDVFRATLELRAEEDSNGAPSAGSLNVVFVNGSTQLCSAINASGSPGNGASTNGEIGGDSAQFVTFQSTATNLIAGFANSNGAGADVYVRRLDTATTLLVSHATGNAATGGSGASESPSIDPTGTVVAFESVASDLIAGDTNGVRDVFYARIDSGSPFTKTRASVSATGAQASGDSSHASVHLVAGGRVLVAFDSSATDLAPGLVAPSNVYLFDSATGHSTLLNQRVSPTGNAIGNGAASGATIAPNGQTVVFESAASNIDVLRAIDLNHAQDVFLVEVPQVQLGNVLPFRLSITATSGAEANGASSSALLGNFDADSSFPVGVVAYTTQATNLGTSDSTKLMVSFLSETSGVFASFSATPPRGAAPLTVQFTDSSSGDPDGWQWDFDNDGTIDSTAQNPSFVYQTPGLYTVRLVARNANGQGERIENDFVLAVGPVVPDFTASVPNGVAPLSVTFTDTSTQSPTSWQWDFDNDGTIDSTLQNPTHIYNTPGVYTVRLVATNEVGPVTVTKTNLIEAFQPVVAGFTRSPSSGVAPLLVNFTNTSTGATSYSWDFNEDGIPDSTATNPSFTYNSAGTFDVTLTATGPGGVDVFTFTNCVTAFGAVSASFTMTVAGSPITSAYESTNILFTSTSTGSITSFAWDFDFVSNPGTLTSSASSLTRNFASTTASTRVFVVRLFVSGPGGSSSVTHSLTIVSNTESVTLTAVADTTIYEDATGNSNGGGANMVVGRPAGTTAVPPVENFSRRALLRFDVSGIPASSTINSATLQIVSDTPVLTTGTQTIRIHRVTEAWTEGTASGTAGVGAATASGGATWLNRSFSTAWGTTGGSVAAFNSSFTNVSTPATHTASVVTDVQAWVNGTANNGWQLRNSNEGNSSTAKRFFTRQAITIANRPQLTVNYTRPLP